jgi:hypothetical protein
MGFLKKILKRGVGGKVAAKLGDPAAKKLMRTGGAGPRASATGQANASSRSRMGRGNYKNDMNFEPPARPSAGGRRVTGGNTPASRITPRMTGGNSPSSRTASETLNNLGSRIKKPRGNY